MCLERTLENAQKLMLLAKKCYEGRNEGMHCWIRHEDNWITFEPITDEPVNEGEEHEDCVLAVLTDEIDSLGYPSGNTLDVKIISPEYLE